MLPQFARKNLFARALSQMPMGLPAVVFCADNIRCRIGEAKAGPRMLTTETPIQFRDFPGHALPPVGRIGLDTPRGLRRTRRDPLRVGLLIPLCGPAGLWGPSCQCSAELAAAEINRDGGILGREVELVLADAAYGGPWDRPRGKPVR